MQDLQRHQYAEAAQGFKWLIERFPGEGTLLDRARVYLELCERELRRRPSEPKTVEERLTAATAALNDGNEALAERLARAVLEEQPRQDLALYLLAAIAARQGSPDVALGHLARAIGISPEASAQARHDPDFESLRGLPAFRQLTEPAQTPPGMRRARRGRPER